MTGPQLSIRRIRYASDADSPLDPKLPPAGAFVARIVRGQMSRAAHFPRGRARARTRTLTMCGAVHYM